MRGKSLQNVEEEGNPELHALSCLTHLKFEAMSNSIQIQQIKYVFTTSFCKYTGNLYKVITRLGECCRQVEAEEESNSRSKIHQTSEQPHSKALYFNFVSNSDKTGLQS